MTQPRPDAAQRMIEATIQLIEAEGVGKVTVRAVAAAAEVNIAAVSYHFGGKRGLVAAALEGSIRHMVADSETYLARLPAEPAALTELLGYMLEGSLRYPRLTQAHLHAPLVSGDFSGPFPVLLQPLMVTLRDRLRELVPGLRKPEAGRRVVAAMSAVLYPASFDAVFEGLRALGDARSRRAYAEELAAAAVRPVARTATGTEAANASISSGRHRHK